MLNEEKKGLYVEKFDLPNKSEFLFFWQQQKLIRLKNILNVSYIMVYHNQQNRKALLKKNKKVYTISTICKKKKIIGNGSLELE